jgi:hypothetical protein
MNRRTRLAIAISTVALFAPASSHALDDVANGRRLATKWAHRVIWLHRIKLESPALGLVSDFCFGSKAAVRKAQATA